MMKLKAIPLMALLLVLGGCAPSLNMWEMMPKTTTFNAVQDNQRLKEKITEGIIFADDGLGDMGGAPVRTPEYKGSVIFALRQAGWYASAEKAQYVLDAHLTKVEQPLLGFDMTVKTTVSYSLKKKQSGETVYKDTLILPCTTRFAEAINGQIRMRMATACAVGENTTHFMKVLNSKYH